MAKKRMFHSDVVDTDRFRDMSRGARLLYYDLGVAADDDGAAQSKTVMRTTRAKMAELKELERNGYIRILDDHLVIWITDWKLSNRIPRDRYHPGPYARLVQRLEAERSGDKTYQDGEQSVDKMDTDGEHSGDKMSTEVRLDSGKDRSGKERKEKERKETADRPQRAPRFTPPTEEEVRAYVLERGSGVDPRRFVDFYASKGWRVGSQPMRDWRAAVRTWERREDGRSAPSLPSEADYREGW